MSTPIIDNNTDFEVRSLDAVCVNSEADLHLPWYANIRSVYGVGLDDITETNARTLATQRYQTRNYRGSQFRISYRLDNKDSCLFIDELGPKVHEEGPWLLTEFIPE